jgi:hypothetical protein
MSLSQQSADHRHDLIRALRSARSRGVHSLDSSDRARIFACQVAVGDWNRAHSDNLITSADVELPLPNGLIVSFTA